MIAVKILAWSSIAAAAAFSPQVSAQEIQVPPFNSIEVPNNAHVILRPGSAQHLTLMRGSLDYSRLRVTPGGVLVIDKCRVKCPRDYQLEIEIQLPRVAKLAVADGGWIRSEGSFSRQSEIGIEVSNGGTIDTRSIPVDRVIASIDQGGRIRTVAGVSLSAIVTHGGVITYWGSAKVKSSILDGGSVEKGNADEIDAPPVDDGN